MISRLYQRRRIIISVVFIAIAVVLSGQFIQTTFASSHTVPHSNPDSFNLLVNRLFDILLPLSVILGVILIARAGYILMTSQGDPAKTQEGKEHLTSAIMGLLFVLLSIGILQTIVRTIITG